jgi:GST-like protein
MLKFYYNLGPNPMKVALLLEELELPYDPVPVDTHKGEQFSPEFTALNPNNKVPCIVDGDAVVFDSNAILLYLGGKTGSFMGEDTLQARGDLLSWLMFVATGVGPYSGQAFHFRGVAPEPRDYAQRRYDYETRRHYGILNDHLASRHYMLGDHYTIVDMAVWGWARLMPVVLGDPEAWAGVPNLKRLFDEISARPAAARANALRDRHSFKPGLDEEAKKYMFRHTLPAA